MTDPQPQPRSHYGYTTLVCLVVANMVGAGVFTTSGFTLMALGSPWQVILAWGIGGIIALAGAASYGQLIRVMPMSGGEYLFLSRAVHPAVGFLAGWISLVAGFSGAAAIAARAMESYVFSNQAHPANLPPGTLAIGMIIIGAVLHGVRVHFGAGVQNIVVILKMLLMACLCAVALFRWRIHQWHFDSLDLVPRDWLSALTAFASSLVWISFSYSGFNAAVYVAGEVERPAVTVAQAMWHATVMVTILYLVLNTIFVLAVPAEQLADKEDVAAIAARALGGRWLDACVRITIILALGTSVLSLMMAGPRVYAKMADDGLMPRWFRFHAEAPRAAIALQAVLAIAFVVFWSLRDLLSYLGLTLSLSAAATVGCLFLPDVRSRSREIGGQSRVEWLPPAVFVMATIVNGIFLGVSNSRQLVGTAGTIVTGGLMYFIVRRFGRREMQARK